MAELSGEEDEGQRAMRERSVLQRAESDWHGGVFVQDSNKRVW